MSAGWSAATPGSVAGSYTTGIISGTGDRVGGLAGRNQSTGAIRTSYSTARVSGNASVEGLTASYWDTSTSGRTVGAAGRTTAALQSPTGYTGIYSQWNVDLDGDSTVDDPWHFGTTAQYPALAVDVNGAGGATWQELGYQLRGGPTLTLTADGRPVALSWTAVVASAWSPAPEVTYNVTRDNGTTVTVIGEALSELTDGDTVVPVGVTHTEVVEHFKAGGRGWQTRIDAALREWIAEHDIA